MGETEIAHMPGEISLKQMKHVNEASIKDRAHTVVMNKAHKGRQD